MQKRYQRILPSLVLALGILAATGIAVLAPETGWLVLAGPLALAGSVVAASVLQHRLLPGSQTSLRVGIALGAIFFVAAVIVALRDPTQVASIIPILGGGAVVVLSPGRCARELEV